jgi:CD109 antigen
LDYITYEVIGRGDVLVSNTIPLNKEKSVSFKFMGTFAMVPKATLLVYYIRPDGEMVSDRVEVSFGDELNNFVSSFIYFKKYREDSQLSLNTFYRRDISF